jgi:hypothetical protein
MGLYDSDIIRAEPLPMPNTVSNIVLLKRAKSGEASIPMRRLRQPGSETETEFLERLPNQDRKIGL